MRRAPAHDPRVFRVVHWNIEKGKQLERIVARLTQDPYLADADVYCLNEVDVGMARSGNRDVAAVLADALQCDSVFVPNYIECTKGPHEEAHAPGENELGLHGLAILSRHPFTRAWAVALPECFDYFGFLEKRFGGRRGLLAEIEWGGAPFVVATTHLEVRNTPECRARQLAPLLSALAEPRAPASIGSGTDVFRGSPPVVLTGDLNTNSFRRGAFHRAAVEFARIVATAPEKLDSELVAPYAREPVFALLEGAGFAFRPHTDGRPTAAQVLGRAEDLEMVPELLRGVVSRTSGLGERVLRMRLDWIATKGVVPAGPPRTHEPIVDETLPASDHALISAEVARPG
jgi:endonuclease/exonuclease/phosphatase family metal-dependent hydrolase